MNDYENKSPQKNHLSDETPAGIPTTPPVYTLIPEFELPTSTPPGQKTAAEPDLPDNLPEIICPPSPPPVTMPLKDIESARRKNPGYYREIEHYCSQIIPAGMRVLELGCGTGRLLAAVKPCYGLGIDLDPIRIAAARKIHFTRKELNFQLANIEEMDFSTLPTFDYIIISDILPHVHDIQGLFSKLHQVCTSRTRLVITCHSNLWRPVLKLATLLRRRKPDPNYNWLSTTDIENLLYLADFEKITRTGHTLLPVRAFCLSWFVNRILANLPFFNWFCLTWYITARLAPTAVRQKESDNEPSVSVLIPTRNEKGNIADACRRTPNMGKWTELVFVDGNSDDGTYEEIQRCMNEYSRYRHRMVLLRQKGRGKGQAVRQGFAQCRGDILMILDSDLTMPPEELPKYYQALVSGKGEFINGCRLVYPMHKKAMRFLNMIANHCFARLFTWLLNQPVKDTLCGTKVLWRHDYEQIAANRSYFGDFDPFGDFDLLFGAARLNRKIVDLPIRYRERTYGEIKISRWKHGWLLLKMSFLALRKLKLC